METLSDLNAYIKTPDFNFNNCALRLYLGNVKQPVFAAPVQMLETLKQLVDKIKEHKANFFSFIADYQEFITGQALTPQQYSLISYYVIWYLHKEVNARDVSSEYAKNYLDYFKAIEESAALQKQEALIAEAGIGGMLDDLLQKQVVKLSHDLNEVTTAQKLKAITSLVKTLPELSKTKKETTKQTTLTSAA